MQTQEIDIQTIAPAQAAAVTAARSFLPNASGLGLALEGLLLICP
jgi:hypothetical protein